MLQHVEQPLCPFRAGRKIRTLTPLFERVKLLRVTPGHGNVRGANRDAEIRKEIGIPQGMNPDGNAGGETAKSLQSARANLARREYLQASRDGI